MANPSIFHEPDSGPWFAYVRQGIEAPPELEDRLLRFFGLGTLSGECFQDHTTTVCFCRGPSPCQIVVFSLKFLSLSPYS